MDVLTFPSSKTAPLVFETTGAPVMVMKGVQSQTQIKYSSIHATGQHLSCDTTDVIKLSGKNASISCEEHVC